MQAFVCRKTLFRIYIKKNLTDTKALNGSIFKIKKEYKKYT